MIARASASNAASRGSSRPPSWRRSAKRRPAAALPPSSTPLAASAGECSMSSGASAADRSSAKCARSSTTPINTTSPRPSRSVGAAGLADQLAERAPSQHHRARLRAVDLGDQILVAPERDKEARRIGQPFADPAAVAPAQPGPLETGCGIIIVRSHAPETGTSVAARASRAGHLAASQSKSTLPTPNRSLVPPTARALMPRRGPCPMRAERSQDVGNWMFRPVGG